MRHLRRCLDEPSAEPDTPTHRTEFDVSDEVITAVHLACGNMSQAHQLLQRLNATAEPAVKVAVLLGTRSSGAEQHPHPSPGV